MNNTSTKGDPIVGKVTATDFRTVLIELQNCAREGTGTGNVFVPDRLLLEWHDRTLTRCSLGGRRLRVDGLEWIDGRRSFRSFVPEFGQEKTLDPETPDWVLQLVKQYQP